ncbi:MAG TPA: hypothetical protein VL262_14685 [Vicinamibacterales bacterium]|nr:hypothetical protein [Vicinamibacterales bacterium]
MDASPVRRIRPGDRTDAANGCADLGGAALGFRLATRRGTCRTALA